MSEPSSFLTIREFELRLAAVERHISVLFDKEREQVNLKLMSLNDARDVQARELARRLEELNHAHQKAIEDRNDFVTRDIFTQSQREVQAWREVNTNALIDLKGSAIARDAYEERHNALITRLDALEKFKAMVEGSTGGRSSQTELLMKVLVAIGILITIGGVVVAIAYAVRK